MANQEHLDILKQGVEVWNQWREKYKEEPDLSGANLRDMKLGGADLHETNLSGADLSDSLLIIANLYQADLEGAQLKKATLNGATLCGANLKDVDLTSAYMAGTNLSLSGSAFDSYVQSGHATDLSHANLNNTFLVYTNFSDAILDKADLSYAILSGTIFTGVDLSTAKGLETIDHKGPSYVDIHTLQRSQGTIPEIFLRGVGISDTFITYISSLIGKAIEYYSCFISYSSKDEAFAKRLYADLQSHNVRCWFAPEDMKIGDRIRPRIDESIRLYDKLLLVLSKHSVASKWVEFEVEAAMDKELEGKPPVLFPLRLDNAVMDSTTIWAAHIKRTRHIGDFTDWRNHDDYQKAFERLLRDLKASA